METSFYGLKVAKSSKGYYVGRFFQEDEVMTPFVRLTMILAANKKPLSGSNP
ncbi:hypothetical protein J2Y03_004519 [Neobacillus niacini]|uniref:hypothetical protein n=1 Tax=Neobacillus niacini TaxID=86668 RepID=UPI002864DE5F|nr:hypothetical protein [Neobacillus niacini]MDR7079461.1 hypothetical protein [Neobacillus niacini]